MADSNNMNVVFSSEFQKILQKLTKKDKLTLKKIESQIYKIISNPIVGKPLRNTMKNYRRVQIGSFVLTYRIENESIIFIDYDHHDRVYKKFS